MAYYFAQNATIEVLEPNSTKYKVVGAAQEVSIDTEFEVEEMYEFRSILRTTASRHHASVNVKVSTAQFGRFGTDPAWFWAILNSAGVTSTSFTPVEGEAKTVHQITIEDSTNLPMFSIVGEWKSDDGNADDTIYGRVTGVYFKNFSWGGGLGEYIIEELEGTGSQVMFTDDKDYAVGGASWADVGARIDTLGIEAINTAKKTATIRLNKANQYGSLMNPSISYPTGTESTAKTITASDWNIDSTTGIGTTTVTNSGTTGTAFANVVISADGMSKVIPVTLGTTASNDYEY